MNGYYLSSIEFNSIKVGLIIHDLSFNDTHFVQSETLATRAKELLKLINTINTCLKKLNITLYYS